MRSWPSTRPAPRKPREARGAQEPVLARFFAYAAAFEETYRDHDWTRLEEHFTADARYEVTGGPPLGGVWEGRASLLANLRSSVNALDRRFDRRAIEFTAPPRTEDKVAILAWRGSYQKAGCPDLVFGGIERATLTDGGIALLVDEMEPGSDERIEKYLARYLP